MEKTARWIFIIHLVFLNVIADCQPFEPIIKTENGEVRGTYMFTRTGKMIEAFRGIPYAVPPVGELRFKSPRSVRSWEGILDASKDGPICIQKNYLFANPKVEGQEDCLYLNVYVPVTTNRTVPFPVMVSIHWGGFFAGRATSDYFGPKYITEKNVILVTFNYRLGIFGFLSTLDDEAPGNYALKDQVAALKWVQRNINYFGGDNKRVTLFGASAGAASAHWHMLSPLSKGLFQQAISQSGSAFALWATPLNELHKTVVYGQALLSGCDTSSSKNLVECLRRVDAHALIETGDAFKFFSVDPLTVFTLVTEKKTKRNPKPFITKMPLEYVKSGEFAKVPWIIGTSQNEGTLRAAALLRQTTTRLAFNQNFTALMLKEMFYDVSVGPDEEKKMELHKKVQQMYMRGQNFLNPTDARNIQGFIDLWSDRSFKYGTYQSAMIHAASEHMPIWVYSFEYKGKNSYVDLWAATNETLPFDWGTAHCDDTIYLFDSPALFPKIQETRDVEMSRILLERWTNFAIFGTPQRSTYDNFWDKLNFTGLAKMKNENLYFLNITGSFNGNPIEENMQRGFLKDRMLFWASQQIFENFPGLQ